MLFCGFVYENPVSYLPPNRHSHMCIQVFIHARACTRASIFFFDCFFNDNTRIRIADRRSSRIRWRQDQVPRLQQPCAEYVGIQFDLRRLGCGRHNRKAALPGAKTIITNATPSTDATASTDPGTATSSVELVDRSKGVFTYLYVLSCMDGHMPTRNALSVRDLTLHLRMLHLFVGVSCYWYRYCWRACRNLFLLCLLKKNKNKQTKEILLGFLSPCVICYFLTCVPTTQPRWPFLWLLFIVILFFTMCDRLEWGCGVLAGDTPDPHSG